MLVRIRTVPTERLHVEVIIMVSTRVILIAFPSFSKPLQENVETLSQLGHDGSLRNHLPSFYHRHYLVLDTDSVVK
jgi:hypothetical protein